VDLWVRGARTSRRGWSAAPSIRHAVHRGERELNAKTQGRKDAKKMREAREAFALAAREVKPCTADRPLAISFSFIKSPSFCVSASLRLCVKIRASRRRPVEALGCGPSTGCALPRRPPVQRRRGRGAQRASGGSAFRDGPPDRRDIALVPALGDPPEPPWLTHRFYWRATKFSYFCTAQ
jgi:hypothetical protein